MAAILSRPRRSNDTMDGYGDAINVTAFRFDAI